MLSVIPFDTIDEVVTKANDTPFGLGSGLWTRDVSKVHHVSRRLKAGMVWVNCYGISDPGVPWGGYKMSGHGRESGLQHVDEFLNVKAVTINFAL